jgi:hypothetical protein
MRVLLLAALLISACGGAVAPGRPPTEPAAPSGPTVLVTRADDQRTVHARVGDRIQVALGSDYAWRLDPPDGVVLVAGVQRELLVRGTQAVWTAAAPGTATISATGAVVCPSGQACIMLAVLFRTTVVVDP